MTNVRAFGAVGDGRADDTEAIRHAVNQGDGSLLFPGGTYRLTAPIDIDLDRSDRPEGQRDSPVARARAGVGDLARPHPRRVGRSVEFRGTRLAAGGCRR